MSIQPTTQIPGKVRLRDGALIVETWRSADTGIVASAQRAQTARIPLDVWLDSCLRVGAAATLVASNGSDVAQAQRALDALASGVDRSVADAMARLTNSVDRAIDPDDGAIAAAVQAGVDRLANGVSALITGPDARVPERIRTEVTNAGAAMLAEIQRALLTQQSAMSAAVREDRAVLTAQVQQAVQGQQSAILTALAELRASMATAEETNAVRSRLTSAGTEFERDVVELIGQIALDAGDAGATACGSAPSESGSKAGDAVIDLADGGRIVIEAKRRQARLSTDAWRRELQSARANRGADVAIGVTTPDATPTRGRAVCVIGQDLVVAYDGSLGYGRDLLAGVYLLARLQVAIHRRPSEAADIGDAIRDVELLLTEVERLSGVQRQAGQIASAAQRLMDTVAEIRDAASQHAARALTRLRTSPADGEVRTP